MNKRINFFEILFLAFSLWYFLPVSAGIFSADRWKIIFFGCYVASMGLLLLSNLIKEQAQVTYERKKERNVLIPILIYMAVFVFFVYLDWKDADKHIRVSYTYWGVYLFYYFAGKHDYSRHRIAKVLILAYIVTYVCTFAGVISDQSVVRALSYAATEEDIQRDYLLRNIASVYFIQTSVLLVPLAMRYGFYEKECSKKVKILAIVFLACELYFVMSASLTISVLLYFVAIILSVLFLSGRKFKIMQYAMMLFTAILLLVLDFGQIFSWLAQNIENEFIQDRFHSLASMFSGTGATGDVGLRMDLYTSSLKTFANNLFGIGPNYSYIKFHEGIGHHSQMFDDFARYGIFGVIFYIVFLGNYYRMIKTKYAKIDMGELAIPIIILFTAMLILNLAFRSPYESVFMLYIIPGIADVLYEKKQMKGIET